MPQIPFAGWIRLIWPMVLNYIMPVVRCCSKTIDPISVHVRGLNGNHVVQFIWRIFSALIMKERSSKSEPV